MIQWGVVKIMTSPISREDLIKHIDCLKKSPLFQVSLASKELFHSNFWAWLFETPKDNSVSAEEYVKVFFQDFSSSRFEVRREFMNMDLVIEAEENDGKKLYVIENKIKSAPRKKQLEDYSEKLAQKENKTGHETKGRLLTSILEPNFTMPEDWSSKRLSTIADKLEPLAKREDSSYRKSLINDYIGFIKSLSSVMELGTQFNGTQKYNFHIRKDGDNKQFLKELLDLRIYDLYVKRGGSMLMAYLQKELQSEDFFKYLHSGSSFNNGKCTCEWYFSDTNNINFRIGIQIEGDQYRRFIMVAGHEQACKEWLETPKNAKKLPSAVEKLVAANPIEGWFVADPRSAYGNKMRGQFCFYKPNFFYQYKILNGETFEKLSDYLIEDLKLAYEMMLEQNHKPKSEES